MSIKALAAFATVLFLAILTSAQEVPRPPKLLLSAQRLRGLKRQRERHTIRWANFERRVNTVPDSPERGFELALYYVITGDEAKGREAVRWALTSQATRRQKDLVLDWCASLISAEEKKRLRDGASSFIENGRFSLAQTKRDLAFVAIACDDPIPSQDDLKAHPEKLRESYRDPEDLYAMIELIDVIRANTHQDLRDFDRGFFAVLPQLVLLSALPRDLNSPSWIMHVAALALVAIDPNLPASQYLQSWAMEDSQMLSEGPGVAYELLWADPYLPGVGYQNMDTWIYTDFAQLFARSSWEPNSCWIEISARGRSDLDCSPAWKTQTSNFGHLTLIPMTGRCVDIPRLTDRNQAVVVWKLPPNAKLVQGNGKDRHTSEVDAAGLWRPGANIEGRVCVTER